MPTPSALERLVDSLNAFLNALSHQPHDAVGGGQEQLAFAAEITVKGALADLQFVGQKLRVGVGVAMLREQLHGRLQNLLLALGAALESPPRVEDCHSPSAPCLPLLRGKRLANLTGKRVELTGQSDSPIFTFWRGSVKRSLAEDTIFLLATHRGSVGPWQRFRDASLTDKPFPWGLGTKADRG